MQPAEYLGLIISAGSALGGHVSNFIAAVSAYLMIAHFVSAQLSRWQVWIISVIYTAFCFLPAQMAVKRAGLVQALTDDFHGKFPQAGDFVHPQATHPPVLILLALTAWAMSIVFMIQQRKKSPYRTEQTEQQEP